MVVEWYFMLSIVWLYLLGFGGRVGLVLVLIVLFNRIFEILEKCLIFDVVNGLRLVF